MTRMPVSRVTALSPPEAVSPLSPGGASVTVRVILMGSSMLMADP